MRLSAPLYRLKRRAKILSREKMIPLHSALDRIAKEEGFVSWSLLSAKASANAPAQALLSRLAPGDLVLLGARPGHGKTVMGLELLAEAIAAGRKGIFFSLEYNDADVVKRFDAIGAAAARDGTFAFDNSDEISAPYVMSRMASEPRGTLAVIDYLQLLDQNRSHPDLMTQVRSLKAFAQQRGFIIVFISQIDRSYEMSKKPLPGLEDVRLPNPLDLTFFNKTCFLHEGEIRIDATG